VARPDPVTSVSTSLSRCSETRGFRPKTTTLTVGTSSSTDGQQDSIRSMDSPNEERTLVRPPVTSSGPAPESSLSALDPEYTRRVLKSANGPTPKGSTPKYLNPNKLPVPPPVDPYRQKVPPTRTKEDLAFLTVPPIPMPEGERTIPGAD
jgi:hypothetical protein